MTEQPAASAQELTPEQRKELEEKLKNMSPEEIRELQKQQCIFCQILAGKIPSKKVYEDDVCIAILDINPAAKGHLLLIPKEHFAIMPQMPDPVLGHLFVVAKSLSKLLLRAMRTPGTNLFVANGPAAGQRAQHFMVHIIPRKEGDGLLDAEEKLIDAATQQKVEAAIKERLTNLLGESEQETSTSEDEVAIQDDEKENKIENKMGDGDSKEDEESNDEQVDSGDEETSEDEDSQENDEDDLKDDSQESEDQDSSTQQEDEEPEEDEKEEDDDSNGEASLDDIANLFK